MSDMEKDQLISMVHFLQKQLEEMTKQKEDVMSMLKSITAKLDKVESSRETDRNYITRFLDEISSLRQENLVLKKSIFTSSKSRKRPVLRAKKRKILIVKLKSVFTSMMMAKKVVKY